MDKGVRSIYGRFIWMIWGIEIIFGKINKNSISAVKKEVLGTIWGSGIYIEEWEKGGWLKVFY